MDLEITKEHIDAIVSHEGNMLIKAGAIVLWAVIIAALFAIYRVFGGGAALVVLFLLVAFVEWKLGTNKRFTSERVSIKDALAMAKTGDLVFFRSFHTYDIPELLIFRYLAACISATYFGHVGMIVRIGGRVYIAECTEDMRFDELTQSEKNGPLLNLAEPRIREYYGRVHICRTNLDGVFMQNMSQVHKYIHEWKDHSFLQDTVGCMGYVKGLLQAAGGWKPGKRPMSLSSLLYQNNYLFGVQFDTPLLIQNKWVVENT